MSKAREQLAQGNCGCYDCTDLEPCTAHYIAERLLDAIEFAIKRLDVTLDLLPHGEDHIQITGVVEDLERALEGKSDRHPRT